jgi:type IV secretory pathway TraG/TraD family ATPase VirD4
MSDYTVSAKIREANVALLVLTQSQTSLLPPHKNKDQAHVLMLNLRNRMIFRAADEECAKRSADFIGKKRVQKRSRSIGNKGVQYSYQEAEEHKVKTWQLRQLPSFSPILIHVGKPGRFKRSVLQPLTGREVHPFHNS